MKKTAFSDLTPSFFLQTFVLELMHAVEQEGHSHNEELIEHIARTAGQFFEETYRDGSPHQGPLDREAYIDCILGLKNHIGGNFSLVSCDPKTITVHNTRCPFGEGVMNFPELCRMTSSVFGGIAARNFGYAKVEIQKAIAKGDGCCAVRITTDSATAKNLPGLEYFNQCDTRVKQDFDKLKSRIDQQMQRIWRRQAKKPVQHRHPPEIIAKSPGMHRVLKTIEVVAPTLATVLIQGETGVGKELVARAIHAMSDRKDEAFVALNCGAIPENLIESALFGHEKGAFTGALEVHQGVFERARGGTLFLDEVDTLSAAAQTRLLRVLQEGEMERVGGKLTLSIDTRIIAATNQALEEHVEKKQFRKDLYFRINVVRLMIPPLRERAEDLPYLVNHILHRLNSKYNKSIKSVNSSVMREIRGYSWPGNVRELENVLERSVLFTTGSEVTTLELEPRATDSAGNGEWPEIKQLAVDQAEKTFLECSLDRSKGNVKKVAEFMGISPRAVYTKLKKHRINPGLYRSGS
ncbi:MAG: sigma 54-interacting transcriptional regulator [Gammaproteobacteria bacterium]